ncbi:MAG: GtrA family protein [Pseudomonadota bacterium]
MSSLHNRPWMQRGHLVGDYILHCLTGLLAVSVHYGVMYLALLLSIPALGATSLGFACGGAVRFLLSYFHIFEPEASVPVALGRFLLALTLQFVANGALFSALLASGLPTWPAQLLASLLLTTGVYLMYRYWVFRRRDMAAVASREPG